MAIMPTDRIYIGYMQGLYYVSDSEGTANYAVSHHMLEA